MQWLHYKMVEEVTKDLGLILNLLMERYLTGRMEKFELRGKST
jgi:hypothetical protein